MQPLLAAATAGDLCCLLQCCSQLQLPRYSELWSLLEPRLLELLPSMSAGSVSAVAEELAAWGGPIPSDELQGLMEQLLRFWIGRV